MIDAPRLENTHQVRSFIGLVNYYARFIPNLSEILHPLNQSLRKGLSGSGMLIVRTVLFVLKS